MTMEMEIAHQATYAGPLVHKTSEENPAKVILELMGDHPSASREELMRQFRKRMSVAVTETPGFLTPLCDRYFYHEYNNILAYRRRSERESVDGGTRRVRARREQEEKAVKAATKRIVKAVLLDLVLPTGKVARDSTFGECRRVGGFWAEVGKRGKPDEIVGKMLTEADLRTIWRETSASRLRR
jgi:hypothetical protein